MSLIRNLGYWVFFYIGCILFKLTRRTPRLSYVSYRQLFYISNRRVYNWLNNKASKDHPIVPLKNYHGILGELDDKKIARIILEVNDKGYYIFPHKLPIELIDKFKAIALSANCSLIPDNGNGKRPFDPNEKPLAPRYQLDEQELINNYQFQEFISDRSMLAIAQKFLNCSPINDNLAMWWSTPFSKEASSEASQLYHRDMDRAKFIKFFIYLTDVEDTTGPHAFVQYSHNLFPKELNSDSRKDDALIEKMFKKENCLRIGGKKGTIMMVNTLAYHKGTVVEEKNRLLLQMKYAVNLFGAPYTSLSINEAQLSPRMKEQIKESPRLFERIAITNN